MHEFILHIGYSKTGTTWFQKEFFPKVKNITFFDHKRFIDVFNENINSISNNSYDFISEKIQDERKKIVISDENMLGGYRKISANAQNYAKLFPDSKIILFIRNQIDKFASEYSQYIKEGGTENFKGFLSLGNIGFPYGGMKHKYSEIINIYRQYFSEKNIYVFLYEDLKFDRIKTIDRVIKIFDFNIKIENINFAKRNRGLGIRLLQLKRYFNYLSRIQPNWIIPEINKKKYLFHLPFWHQFSYLLFAFLNHLFAKGKINYSKIMGEKNIEFLTNYFKESNQILIDKYGLHDIKKYNYPL